MLAVVKYVVMVEWERLLLHRGRLRKPLTAEEVDAFLDGLDHGVVYGKPKSVDVKVVFEEISEEQKQEQP